MLRNQAIKLGGFGLVAVVCAIGGLGAIGCGSDTGGGGGSGGSGAGGTSVTTGNPQTTTGNPQTTTGNPTTTSGNPTTTSGNPTTSVTTGGNATTGVTTGGGPTPVPTEDMNALMCPAAMCTVLGKTGSVYAYGDKGPDTTYGASMTEACLAGTTSVTGMNDLPTPYAYYGIGLGINLGPVVAPATSPDPLQLTGSGLTVKLSNLPTGGARVTLEGPAYTLPNAGTSYCATLATASATLKWSDFNSACWAPATGTALAAAPATPHINIQVVSGAAKGTANFCVETLDAAP